MNTVESTAVYTVVYPGVERFLGDWVQSLRKQTDQDFDLWVSLDGLEVARVANFLGKGFQVFWISSAGDTPAGLRQKAIQRMVSRYQRIIFVDSDDMLDSTRVEAAKIQSEQHDVGACALQLVDAEGGDLGVTMGDKVEADAASLLPRHNIFGLSNTVYRTELLRYCLPIPADCAFVDWHLITRAWLLGASIGFDSIARMRYRQHSRNSLRTLPPFGPADVARATRGVVRHYAGLGEITGSFNRDRWNTLVSERERVERFERVVVANEDRLRRYCEALKAVPFEAVWWWAVAHPVLNELWN